MKKLYSIVLMAAALLIGTNMRAVEVADLAGLQGALATGGDITLTADIDAGSTALTVGQGITLNGNGHCVKSTDKYVFMVATTSAVKFENLIIYAAKTSAGRGIAINDLSNTNVALDNVTINAQERGMDIFCNSANTIENVTLSIKNSTIQLVHSGFGISYDAQGNPSNPDIYNITAVSVNNDYSRGVNIGRLVNSNITIENSTVQGFFYGVNNISGTMNGTTVTTTNCTFKGRCAYNIWGQEGNWIANDANVIGLNNWSGHQESFACFVLYGPMDGGDSRNNHLTINGGTVAAASFDAVGMANPYARQFLLSDRGANNVVVVNNATFTCTKEAEDEKGGVVEISSPTSNITINGGNYDCPNIVGSTYSDGEGNTGTITITGGEFVVNTVAPDMTDGDVYSTIEVQGGTYAITETDPVTGETTVIDIKDLADPTDPTNTLISSDAITTIINQDGTVTIVPTGTEQKTVDPAVKMDLVWGTDVVTDANSNVVLQANQTLTLASGSAQAYKLDLAAGAKVIVKDGAQLTLGKGGASFANSGAATKPQILVEQGGTLIVYGQMYGSEKENLLVQASATKHGVLLFDPDMNTYGDNHPKGTFEFVSTKSFYKDATHYQWERFGIPTYTTLESIECTTADLVTNIQIFENGAWHNLGNLTNSTFTNISRLNTPFVTCNLLPNNGATSPANATYRFGGALNGNSNAALNCELTWNPFANSYTADVDIAAVLSGLASSANIDHTIYLATPAGLGTYSWDAVDPVWMAELGQTKLAPMQAFILYNHGMVEESVLNYKNTVWTPAISALAGAPARRSAATEHSAKMRIVVTCGEYTMDNLKMTESATNNHNAVKYMNDDVNIYATSDDKYGIVASEDLNDTYVGFSTVKGGEFTINFTNVDGREFVLVDHETGAQVAIAEGNTYEFTAAANSANDYRFEIVEPAKLPTAIENAEAVKNVKGIYTITGQYVGETNVWNSLPAGVYVVDGAKRVK